MLKSYFFISLRYIAKNRLYSALNVFGLTLGLICFIILGLYVNEQFSRDNHHQNADKIYRVLSSSGMDAKEGNWSIFNQYPLADALNEQMPEISQVVRFSSDSDIVIEANDRTFKLGSVHFADPSVFELFSFNILDYAKPIQEQLNDEIVIVESEAIKLFGSVQKAINSSVKLNNYGLFKVIGVIEDLGQETHLDFEYLLPIERITTKYGKDRQFMTWNKMSAFPTYIKLKEGVEPESIQAKAESLFQQNVSEGKIQLEPVGEVYFSKLFHFFSKHGDKQFVRLYLIVGILILLIGCINYVNLSTARYIKRSKEVGVRKTVGGYRGQIMLQFFMESLILSAIVVVLSFCFTEILLTPFNSFAGSALSIDYQNPNTYGFAIMAIFALGLFAGVYPSVYVSKFSPREILSGKVTKGKGGLFLRNTLVVIQFFICIGLFIATFIIHQQFKFIQNMDLGLDKDQVIMVPLNDSGLQNSYLAFKNELSAQPSIEWVTGAGPKMFGGQAQYYLEIDGSDETTPISIFPVDSDFFQKFGIKLLEGRLYNPELSDSENKFLIVNEALTKVGGWKISDKLGTNVFKADVGVPNLGGVVEDFVFFSVKDEVTPAAYLYQPKSSRLAYVKIKADQLDESLAYLESTYDKFSTTYPFEYSFLDQEFAQQYANEKKLASIFTAFSGIAIIIALLGLFGLTLFVAEQRLKEFSIRKVLGANQFQLVWLMNSGISRMLLISTIFAIPLVYWLIGDWVNSFAFRIELSWVQFVIPVIAVILFAWSTTLYLSLQSARKNPVDSLRSE